MITHFVVWDEIVRFGWSRALCGAAVPEADIAIDPSCPACQHELARTAAEVFGPPAAALDRVPRPAPLRAPRRRRRGVA